VDPLTFDFRPSEFDLNLLPVDAEMAKGDEELTKSALQEHLREVFGRLPGKLRITGSEHRVSVIWHPENSRDMDSLMGLAAGLVAQRALVEAETIFRTLLCVYPDHRRALFNLGILLCEQGRLQEAREALKRLTGAAPEFADGWNALGVVLSRLGKRKDALTAFRNSLGLDPQNGHTMRNLGALTAERDPREALPYLKGAAKLLPSDQSARYLYGKCLADTGKPAHADRVLKKAVALDRRSGIADLCREVRTKILVGNLKKTVPRGLRRDVVVFCLTALETFKDVGRGATRAAAFEIASLASGGLNIEDRTSRFRLLSLPGEFSALQLVVYMYVGLRETAPGTDAGIDFSREYEFAQTFRRGKKL